MPVAVVLSCLLRARRKFGVRITTQSAKLLIQCVGHLSSMLQEHQNLASQLLKCLPLFANNESSRIILIQYANLRCKHQLQSTQLASWEAYLAISPSLSYLLRTDGGSLADAISPSSNRQLSRMNKVLVVWTTRTNIASQRRLLFPTYGLISNSRQLISAYARDFHTGYKLSWHVITIDKLHS